MNCLESLGEDTVVRCGDTEYSAYRLGTFEIEPSRNLIRDGVDQFRIEPRIMDVLCSLAERQGDVVTRDSLIEQHWGTQFGGDESLTRAISHLRKTFKAAGATDPYIETIPKRGYRLRQPVEGLGDQTEDNSAGGDSARKPGSDVSRTNGEIPIPVGYSVAVVPLHSSDGLLEQALAEDIGRDLVQMLSHTPHLRVAAYAEYSKDSLGELGPGELGRLLNVHYLVSGSIVRADRRFKLRIELIDTIANRHILSWKLQEPVQRFLSNLDSFILDLSTPIVCEIQIAEASLAHTREPEENDAHAAIQSTEMLRTAYSSRRAAEIIDHLEHLLQREPDNALAHASLAAQLAQNIVSGWSQSPPADLKSADAHIKRALKLAPRDPDVQASAGIVAFMTRKDRLAVQFLQRSLENNPNNPHALAVLGFQRGLTRYDRIGIEMIRTAEKRAPHHPRYSVWALYRGSSLLAAGDIEESVKAYQQAIDRNPNYHLPFITLATALCLAGCLDEARAAVIGAREANPAYSLRNWEKMLEQFPELYHKQVSKAQIVELCREAWRS